MTLRSTDLNLLPVLKALLEYQSVSRASEVLGMTQPAASNSLRRLRALFDDPLLFQVGRSMQLTPRARELLPHLGGVCDGIETLLQSPKFDPASAKQTFVITTPDYAAFLITADILETLRRESPGVTVQFVNIHTDFAEHLHSEYDLAIIAIEQLPPGLERSEKLPDRMVAVVHKDHPLTQETATPETLRSYPELRFRIGSHIGERNFPTAHQTEGRARVALEQFTLLPFLTIQSECVAFVPRSLALYFSNVTPVRIIDLPGDGWIFNSYAMWSQARNLDPAHRWFRGMIEAVLDRRFRSASQ